MRTGTANETITVTPDRWKGYEVSVRHHSSPGWPASCNAYEHDLAVMHHHADGGEHYCPTGFLTCDRCFGTADEPGEPECTLWGTRPPDEDD